MPISATDRGSIRPKSHKVVLILSVGGAGKMKEGLDRGSIRLRSRKVALILSVGGAGTMEEELIGPPA
jgi:hypothetical protein